MLQTFSCRKVTLLSCCAVCLPKMLSLLDTQTPDVLSLTPNTKLNIIRPTKAWGRLYSTYIHLEPVDLKTSTFKLGRAEECDVVITENKVPIHRVVAISKTHFIITREDNLAYIQDVSKNGTFLNGKLIGKGRTHILQNDDEISIGFRGLKIYIYKVLSDLESNNDLPPALRKKYQISRLLGRGASGEVRMVFHKETLKAYAVKKIVKAKSFCGNMNRPERIEREISIMKSLNHPCVLELLEIEETADCMFIVLEYMEGGELTDLVRTTHPINEGEAKFIFYQILLGVNYLHSHGIIHRDLKPENVLLKQSKAKTMVKISDFGLSRIINEDEDDERKTICGTPMYVAPEIISRRPYSYPADIWSLGILLYYMLTQEAPFDGADEKKKLSESIRSGDVRYDAVVWDNISEEARNLVEKMLVVDPVQRMKLCDILKHPWIDEDVRMLREVSDLLYGQSATYVVSCVDSDSESSAYDSEEPPFKRSRSDV